jgi:hypothetical protein
MEIMCIIMVIVLIIIVILWKLTGSYTYRPPPPLQYPSMAPPPTPGQIKLEREVNSRLTKIRCQNCGMRYEQRLDKCPACGER